ncbi:MAG: twin-arginine translocase TatA/TatE family subunit [Acidimicrobiales bacterium]
MFLAELAPDTILIVVIVVVVLLFGGTAIPKLARNLGSAKTEFEKGLKSSKSADDSNAKTTDTTETKKPDAEG